MKYTEEQIRKRQVQGDVVLIPVDSLPEGARPIEGKILQQSETTGHHHHFHGNAAVEVYETGATQQGRSVRTITEDMGKYIVVKDVAELFHGTGFEQNPTINRSGDHASQTILPGIYQVVITREFDYDAMETVRVVD